MKHFRILEKKNISKIGSVYIIQYLKTLIFGLSYWKTIYWDDNDMSSLKYIKYEDALNKVKKIIKKEDYETSNLGYHYVDAYKIFKFESKVTPKVASKISQPKVTKTNNK